MWIVYTAFVEGTGRPDVNAVVLLKTSMGDKMSMDTTEVRMRTPPTVRLLGGHKGFWRAACWGARTGWDELRDRCTSPVMVKARRGRREEVGEGRGVWVLAGDRDRPTEQVTLRAER